MRLEGLKRTLKLDLQRDITLECEFRSREAGRGRVISRDEDRRSIELKLETDDLRLAGTLGAVPKLSVS